MTAVMDAAAGRAALGGRRLLWVVGLVAGCHPNPACPCTSGPVEVGPGSHVRILAPAVAESALVGHVLALEDDALLLQSGLSRVRLSVPYGDIETLEVTYGTSRGEGKATGALVGAFTIGILLGLPAAGFSRSSAEAMQNFSIVTLGGAAIGAAIGSLTAGGSVGEWIEVEVPGGQRDDGGEGE